MLKTSEMWFELNPNEFVRNFGDYEVTASYIKQEDRRQFHFKNWEWNYDFFNRPEWEFFAEEMDSFCEECLKEIEHPVIYQVYGYRPGEKDIDSLTEDDINECTNLLYEGCAGYPSLTLKQIIAWLENDWYIVTEIMPMIRYLRGQKNFNRLSNWLATTIVL